jgi:hypothetical protein
MKGTWLHCRGGAVKGVGVQGSGGEEEVMYEALSAVVPTRGDGELREVMHAKC